MERVLALIYFSVRDLKIKMSYRFAEYTFFIFKSGRQTEK